MKKALSMEKLKELSPHPLFESLPESLKDVKEFVATENRLAKMVYSDHTHKTIKAYVRCKSCKEKFNKKKEAIKALGFETTEQYLLWRKVMGIILREEDIQLT